MEQGILQLEHIKKGFRKDGERFPVLEDISLTLQAGDFFVLLGRSGCGKTTLLRIAGGFLKAEDGSVFLDGEAVTKPGVEEMMVFQDFNQLFPWMTLKKNVTYAMKKARPEQTKAEREAMAAHFIEAAGLKEFANEYPAALSGGMKQRGALARALALQPRVLLMDEPFSSLDYLSRQTARQTVQKMAKETGCTVLLVTHDLEEAVELGTKIGILDVKTHRISQVFDAAEYPDKEELGRILREAL